MRGYGCSHSSRAMGEFLKDLDAAYRRHIQPHNVDPIGAEIFQTFRICHVVSRGNRNDAGAC